MIYSKSYIGSYASLDPELSARYSELFTGYSLSAANIGATTSIQTANQLAEVEARLREGINTVEMGTMSPEIFEQIPKQHFEEMKRLAKLANAEVTIHGPLIDPSGFTDRGWSEISREEAERHLLGIIEKAHAINPKGNIPVTIHGSVIPAEDWQKKIGKFEFEKPQRNIIVAINRESGELTAIRGEEMMTLGEVEPIYRSPEERLDSINATEWENHLIKVSDMLRIGDEIMAQVPSADILLKSIMEGKIKSEAEMTPQQREDWLKLNRARLYFEDAATRFRTLYEWVYKYGDEKTKEKMNQIAKMWKEKKELAALDPLEERNILIHSLNLMENITKHNPPKLYQPVTDFALEKAPETIGNVAWEAYKKFGENTPIIAIENVLPNMVFSRAESLAKVIDKSREHFIEKAVASGMKREKAEKEAEKLIGATWDIAHINLMRQKGFKEKEIIAETKKIAPYVKKVHLTDNFGMEHSDLPPGMGNVPIKKMMEEIEKAGFTGKSIIEAGSWVTQFKTSAHPYAIEALSSPIYTTTPSPTWATARGLYGAGGVGYGVTFPEQHFAMYGAGFSALPVSLGGTISGKQSRFSGAPME
ncbi:MAG: hypothetical protein QW041_02700 [Candidatus Pacearchaeota archaeon]